MNNCEDQIAELQLRVEELEEALNGLLNVISETRGETARGAVVAAAKALSAKKDV